MSYLVRPLTLPYARRMIGWAYPPPYDVYSLTAESLPVLLNPDFRYHVVLCLSGDLIGFCCFGEDARVCVGDYSRGEPWVLDVGVGIRPDLTGQGRGKEFVLAVLKFASRAFLPGVFRATIADFNQRSLRTFRRCGFEINHRFCRQKDGQAFTQLERPAFPAGGLV